MVTLLQAPSAILRNVLVVSWSRGGITVGLIELEHLDLAGSLQIYMLWCSSFLWTSLLT